MEFYAFIWVGQYRLTGRELGEVLGSLLFVTYTIIQV